MNVAAETLLGGYRVLDLTDHKGLNCGRMLADMGAEVIKVEPPGGDSARKIGPFYHDSQEPEKSLFWFFYCLNKKGITLELKADEGKKIIKDLTAMSNLVIESFDPGYMSSLGLGYEDLQKINPGLVMASITPFGQSGPYKDYKAADMTAWAMSGPMFMAGHPDRAPVQVSFPQAFLHAGAYAAVGSLVALYQSQISGQGQWVDVSAQEVCTAATMDSLAYAEFLNHDMMRSGPGRTIPLPKGTAKLRLVFPCRDGYMFYIAAGAKVMTSSARAWTEWWAEEGIGVEHLEEFGWPVIDFAILAPDDIQRIQNTMADFMKKYTKAELYEQALKRNLPLVPVSEPGELFENAQLKHREFWIDLEHPVQGLSLTYPGPWAKCDLMPLTDWRPAPTIGEHNGDIYGRVLGLPPERLDQLKQAGVI